MKNNRPIIQQFIRPGWLLAGLLILLFSGVWVVNYVCLRDSFTDVDRLFRPYLHNAFWQIIAILLFTILNFLLISLINRKYAIIRSRTFLPIFIYALFITTWKKLHLSIYPHIATLLFLLSLFIFLSMYKNKRAVIQAFWGSILIALSSLLNPIYLFLLPIAWIGFIQQENFSMRTWLASLMGASIPWAFYFAYQLYLGNTISIFNDLWQTYNFRAVFREFSSIERIYIIVLFTIFIISLFSLYSNMLKDSLQTRKQINLLVILLCLILIVNLIIL